MQNGTQKDAFYFPHDFNARRDEKTWALIKDMGYEGYGMYWVIIECMGERSNHKIEKTPRYLELLADELKTDIDKVEAFIRKLIDQYKLLSEDETYIRSESFLRRMQIREERRRVRQEAGRRGGRRSALKKQANFKHRSSNAQAMLKQCSSNAQAMLKQCSSNAQAMLKQGKEGKKGKERNKKESDKEKMFVFLNDPVFKKTFEDFLVMRAKIRAPATDEAQRLILEKLHKYDIHTAAAMLKQSIERSWRGIFPLKDSKAGSEAFRLEQERRDRERLELRKREASGPDPESRKEIDKLIGKTSAGLAAVGAQNTRGAV